ncbi:MAG: hypothetical protein HRT66_13540 [Flavobacteriaceae bacterium]|nr:hypothetical protein [Flavobacteriaceae bacterium]
MKPEYTRKQEIAILIMGGFMIFGLVYNLFYQRDHSEWLLNNGIKTEGRCINRGGSLLWSYKIGNEWIDNVEPRPYDSFENGEWFEIYYNPDDNEDIQVAYDKFILKGEYINTKSESLKMHWYNKRNVYFLYFIDGEKHVRYQKINYDDNIDLEKTYLVKYKKNNPDIAYILGQHTLKNTNKMNKTILMTFKTNVELEVSVKAKASHTSYKSFSLAKQSHDITRGLNSTVGKVNDKVVEGTIKTKK